MRGLYDFEVWSIFNEVNPFFKKGQVDTSVRQKQVVLLLGLFRLVPDWLKRSDDWDFVRLRFSALRDAFMLLLLLCLDNRACLTRVGHRVDTKDDSLACAYVCSCLFNKPDSALYYRNATLCNSVSFIGYAKVLFLYFLVKRAMIVSFLCVLL